MPRRILPANVGQSTCNEGRAMTQTAFATSSSRVGSRQRRRRFTVNAAVEYRILSRGSPGLGIGYGRTVNISRTGVLFQCDGPAPPIGTVIHLSIAWPVDLDGKVPLKLSVDGFVVRNQEHCIAVEIARSEIRTRKQGELSGAA